MTHDNSSSINNVFSRQILVPQIGSSGQHALECAHAAVVGVGAVGSRIAELLCRAGVGRLTLIDRDYVEFSNLPRQTLYTWSDAEQTLWKSEAARRHLNGIMPKCCVYPKHASLGVTNVDNLLSSVDIIADGTDNVETRYIVNDWCIAHGIPWVYAGAVGTKASVFPVLGKGRCLRCVFPEPPRLEDVPTCDPEGVLGTATALAAAQSATLVLRIILGDLPEPLWRTWDIWTGEYSSITIESLVKANGNLVCPVCR
jgi:molybdopterin-synthase adenylyltransferase